MAERRPRNIILAGIPRSGTTLLTAMMDRAPDTVALNEPRWQFEWARKNRGTSPPEDFARWLVGDYVMCRQKLLKGVPLPERRGQDGTAVTDYYRQNPQTGAMEDTFQTIPFTRPGLTPGFTLAMKHNGLYFGALQQILETGFFEVCVIVRHPVQVIASWNRAPIPLAEGKIPGAIIYWDEMNNITRTPGDLLQKQVAMYDAMCRRIDQFKGQLTLLRYEDIVQDPAPFCTLAGIPKKVADGQINPDRFTQVIPMEEERIAQEVRKTGHSYHLFYPKL